MIRFLDVLSAVDFIYCLVWNFGGLFVDLAALFYFVSNPLVLCDLMK